MIGVDLIKSLIGNARRRETCINRWQRYFGKKVRYVKLLSSTFIPDEG